MKCKKHPSRGTRVKDGNVICKRCERVLGSVSKELKEPAKKEFKKLN